MKIPKFSFILIGYCIFLIFDAIQSARILFLFSAVNLSHKISVWPYVKALSDIGHNVTFISGHDKPLLGNPNLRDYAPPIMVEYSKNNYNVDRMKMRVEGTQWDINSDGYQEFAIEHCIFMFKVYDLDLEFQSIMDDKSFDLVVINGVFNECGFYFTRRMGAKYILYSPTTMLPWFHGLYGAPVESSTIPDLMAAVSFPPTLLDRMWNVYRYYRGYNIRRWSGDKMREVYVQKFNDQSAPSLEILARNASLVFLNTHYSLDFARSLPPVFVSIGGLQCWDPLKELSKKFKDYLDSSEDGAVLITFGSTIDIASLDSFYINIFFNTMRKFPRINFIWRWDGPMPDNHPKNLMASKWLPQREILNHPKTLAFMTHGGIGSMNEATFHGVPLIVVPLFADQDFNAYRIVAQELGLSVEIAEFSQSMMDTAMEEILTNKKYKRNMETRSKIFKDRPQSPVEEAVFWTEFVLRQDDTTALKPMLLEQQWYIRSNVDAYLGFMIMFSGFPLLVLFMMYYLCKYIFLIIN